jgi:uncharacterized protein YdhG (YjbR/CyaY superfamily)
MADEGGKGIASRTIDEYLAGLPDGQRVPLEKLRTQIKAAAPDAVEGMSYGLPAFKVEGRFLVGFGAAKGHLSLYAGRAPVEAFKAELAEYRLWKGTINFKADQPLPADLVTRLVQFRIAEYRES